MNRYLVGPLSGLSCALVAEAILQSLLAKSGTGETHDIATFAGVACGLVAWAATAWNQRRHARCGSPEQPLVSIAAGWAAAVLAVMVVLVAGYITLLIALANGASLVPGGW
jgi:hypothetical protein